MALRPRSPQLGPSPHAQASPWRGRILATLLVGVAGGALGDRYLLSHKETGVQEKNAHGDSNSSNCSSEKADLAKKLNECRADRYQKSRRINELIVENRNKGHLLENCSKSNNNENQAQASDFDLDGFVKSARMVDFIEEERYAEVIGGISIKTLRVEITHIDSSDDVKKLLDGIVDEVEDYQQDSSNINALCKMGIDLSRLKEIHQNQLFSGNLSLLFEAIEGFDSYDFAPDLCPK